MSVAIVAKHLQGVMAGLVSCFGSKELRHRSLLGVELLPVFERGCAQQQKSGAFKPRVVFRHHRSNSLRGPPGLPSPCSPAYFTAKSMAASPMPSAIEPMPIRPPANSDAAMRKPSLRTPRRFSFGTQQLSKISFVGRRGQLSQLFFELTHSEAGERGLHKKSADALALSGLFVSYGPHHENACEFGARDENLVDR